MSTVVLLVVSIAVLTLGAAVQGKPAAAEDTTQATIRHVSKFPVSGSPAQYEVVHQILDFADGAGTREHRHGGSGFVTVLDGQSNRREGNTVTAFGPGETYTEPQSVLHSVRATGRTRVFASFLLSPGSPQTLNDPNFPVPEVLQTTPFLSRTTLGTQPADFDLTQLVIDFAPGAVLALHSHGGEGLGTVIEGELSFRTREGEVRRASGGTFLDVTSSHEVRNSGSARASLILTLLVPKGEQVIKFAE